MNQPLLLQARTARRERVAALAGLAGVLGLAAALRFYNLAGQSLWNDEGTSIALARRSLAEITLGAAADIHPPLYHYLLHFWLLAFGTSEAAARSFSAILGVLLVGLIYLLGRRLFDPLTGWLAALLAAVSSYQVYYSQEARMYMLLTLLCAASAYFFYLGWLAEEPHPRRWAVAAWAVATVLALYTQYLAITVVLAENAAWAISLLRTARRPGAGKRALWPALAWAPVQALVGALYLPWLLLTWGQLHRWPAVSQPYTLLDLLKRALPLFALGPTVEAGPLRGLVAGVLGLAFLGLLWPDRSGHASGNGRLLALLHWLVPLAVLYYLSLSRPLYHPKFLLLATPGFLLLVARGVARLAPERGALPGERLAWPQLGIACAAGLLAVASSLPGLRNYYANPRYARDDYRGIVQYISALGRPGDVVLVNAPGQIDTVGYYYHGPLPLVPMPARRPPSRKETTLQLEQLTRGAQRVFGIFWATNESDPEGIVEGWLDRNCYKALDAWYGKVRLVIYAVPGKGSGDRIQHPMDVNLGGQVSLEGYSLADDRVAAGDILQLSLFWKATNVIQRRYKVFTHLIDPAGHLVGQRDAEPGGGTNFTNTWLEGQRVVDHYGLPTLPGTPPGEYLIEIGMYNPEDGLRLPVVEGGEVRGDRILLKKVHIERPQAPPPLGALDMQRRFPANAGDVQLLGFSFGQAGALDQGPVPLRPGGSGELVLFWQALRAPRHDLLVSWQVVDRNGRVWLQNTAPPLEGRYPLRKWQPQEIVRDPVALRLPADLPPGRYRLLVGWPASASPEPAPRLNELLTFVVQ